LQLFASELKQNENKSHLLEYHVIVNYTGGILAHLSYADLVESER